MNRKFSSCLEEKPLVLMFQRRTTREVLSAVEEGILQGAEGFCLLTCEMEEEERKEENFRKIFAAMQERPVYVTNYRKGRNEGKTDEELAEGLLKMAECGASLCDVMGDMFAPDPKEMTEDPVAVRKQIKLIQQLHEKGAEVIMSSHILQFTSADEIVRVALNQQNRGVDIVKIVAGAKSMEEQLENLKITYLLKKELQVPFLFLSIDECELHRRIGPQLGCCMYLCSLEQGVMQPWLGSARAIRDQWK